MHSIRVVIGGALVALGCSAVPVAAELVYLSSGRTMSVKAHEQRGDLIVLTLRTGGEASFERSLVIRIEPDEVPYPDPPPQTGARNFSGRSSAPLGDVPYKMLIENLSAAHGVNADLVKALIKVESGYRPRARSPKGAMGLMQIMPVTARQYSVRNPYDPRANLDAGIAHLASLLRRFELDVALAAYNAGEAAVRRFGGVPPYRETETYVRRILALVSQR